MRDPPVRFRAGLFVTGTDTGVGKTLVSSALVRLARSWGVRAVGFKPIAAGTHPGGVNEDVAALLTASAHPGLNPSDLGPIQLEAACAPTVAASLEGRELSMFDLNPAIEHLHREADCVIVEGVGGFDVPLSKTWSTAQLAQTLGLPVLLVVGVRLGCMNHAILTARAVQADGLPLIGWIANRLDPDMLCSDETLADLEHVLRHRFKTPCLGRIQRLDSPAYVPPEALHADALRPYLLPT